MKKIYAFVLLMSAFVASAQKPEEIRAELKTRFWESPVAEAQVAAIPDNYKKESAVILYDFRDYDFLIKRSMYRFHRRVLLQDAAAVKEFSEFKYSDFSPKKSDFGSDILAIRIIKKNGSVVELDMTKESKTTDDNIIVAVPSLEPGDIIDYYYHSIFYNNAYNNHEFTLNSSYPKLYMKVNLKVDQDYVFHLNNFNGAPEFTEVPTKGKKDPFAYELEARNLEGSADTRWIYPLVALPSIKWSIYMGESKAGKNGYFKKTLDMDDIFESYRKRFRPFGDMVHIEKYLKGKTFENEAEKVRSVYYFTRHYYFTQYIEAYAISEAKIFQPWELYKKPIFLNSESEFINHFMAFLKDNKIDYDIVIGTARYDGPMSELVIQNNLKLMLRVNATPEPVYLHYFSPFTNADLIPSELENTDAFMLDVLKRKKITSAEPVHLPSTTVNDNKSVCISHVKLDKDLTGLDVTRESSYFGHLKEDRQSDYMYFFDYVNEDYKKFGTESVLERVRSDKKQARYKSEYEAMVNKLKTQQKESLQKSIGSEYGIKVDKYEYDLKNTGRFGKNEPLLLDEKLALENNFVKRAGNNVIVEVGKLIGEQVEIDAEDKVRTVDIYQSYPRSFENEVILEIPEGYTVSGSEKLNKKVENATGGFVSSAKVEGNKLIVKTQKYYKNYFEPQKNWQQMIDFLDAAYQFTQEKVLLKKA